MLALNLDHVPFDRAARSAPLFQLRGKFFKLGRDDRQSGDQRHALARPPFRFATDAHDAIAVRRLRRTLTDACRNGAQTLRTKPTNAGAIDERRVFVGHLRSLWWGSSAHRSVIAQRKDRD